MNISERKIMVLVYILLNIRQQSVAAPINETKYNILVRTLFYRDREGRILLATGSIPKHTERIVREHLQAQMSLKDVKQIRIEPAFKTVQDIPTSRNETLVLLKENYPKYLVAKISNSSSEKIMHDLRRNSFNEPDWYYNVVALDFSPLRVKGPPVLREIPKDEVPSNDTHFHQLPSDLRHENQYSSNIQDDRSPKNLSQVDKSPSNQSEIVQPHSNNVSSNQPPSNPNPSHEPPNQKHQDRNHGQYHIGQPPYHQNPIGQTTESNLLRHSAESYHLPEATLAPYHQSPIGQTTPSALPHDHEKKPGHHKSGEYDTKSSPEATVNQKPTLNYTTEKYEPPTHEAPKHHEPPTNMFPEGRPHGDGNLNKPTEKEAKESPKESVKKTTVAKEKSYQSTVSKEKSSDEKSKSGENSEDDESSMTTKRPQLFIPNDIFYAIEKRCANWSDDCSLHSSNHLGLLGQDRYPSLPAHMMRWPW